MSDDRGVDAIVVLGGRPNRVPVGLALARAGVASTLLVFNADASPADAPTGVEVIAVRPDPYATRGEAAVAARLARGGSSGARGTAS